MMAGPLKNRPGDNLTASTRIGSPGKLKLAGAATALFCAHLQMVRKLYCWLIVLNCCWLTVLYVALPHGRCEQQQETTGAKVPGHSSVAHTWLRTLQQHCTTFDSALFEPASRWTITHEIRLAKVRPLMNDRAIYGISFSHWEPRYNLECVACFAQDRH